MIPITIIDDFFENPDMVVDFANSLTYKTDKDGNWPGKRTGPLHQIHPDFFDAFCRKMFSVYYDTTDEWLKWSVKLYFQKIDRTYKEGWVHQDRELITTIIFLNKDNNPNSGTSIMSKKVLIPKHPKGQETLAILDQEAEETIAARNSINEQFEECISFRNKYNRFISFPSQLYHKAQTFDSVDERLTLVGFVTSTTALPALTNMRRIII